MKHDGARVGRVVSNVAAGLQLARLPDHGPVRRPLSSLVLVLALARPGRVLRRLHVFRRGGNCGKRGRGDAHVTCRRAIVNINACVLAKNLDD